jgi:thiol-disulfide isomerase/thioredoxin
LTNDDVLIGEFTTDRLEEPPHKSWFEEGYQEYEVNKKHLKQLKPLAEDLEVKVFLGTWCPDSKEHVPHFVKIADQLSLPSSAIQFYGLDKEKKMPSDKEEEYDIAYVPTFILKKNGKTIGRIVESPDQSLERDMLDLLRTEKGNH